MADVKLVGRLARDVVSFENKDGSMTHMVTVARPHNYKSADGQYGADFIEFKAFTRTPKANEFYLNNLSKGTLVEVTGDFSSNQYQKNGETVYGVDIIIDNINPFLERRVNKTTPVQNTQQPVQQRQQQSVQQPVQQPVQYHQ